METTFYTQNHSVINGRNIWHYLVSCPIGQINIIQYEQTDLEIKSFLFFNEYDKAERKFHSLCVKMVKGII